MHCRIILVQNFEKFKTRVLHAVPRVGVRKMHLFILLLLASAALTTCHCQTPPRSVDPSLLLVPVLTGLNKPTAIRFSPDGRAFVAEKLGRVYMYK